MSNSLKPIQWWQIWSNPIFKRYTRSRLRPAPLITWIVIVLTLTATLFFLFYYASEYRLKGSPSAAAQDACIPVLFIQMLILLFMGTGSVAGGISREAADGMVDYQRLTPMTPLSKIMGYLFGLPVREYVLFGNNTTFYNLLYSCWKYSHGRRRRGIWNALHVRHSVSLNWMRGRNRSQAQTLCWKSRSNNGDFSLFCIARFIRATGFCIVRIPNDATNFDGTI